MSDLIDRQAAIDAMTNTLWHYPNECYRNLNEYEFAKGLSELGLKSVPSAQPMAVNVLKRSETPNSSDVISRQAAIDAIVNTVSEIGLHDNSEVARYGATFRQHEIIDIIEGMPSAQPYTEAELQKMQELEQAEIQKAYELGREEGQKEAQPEHRWIPCKTALPEKGQYVLCQCRVGIMDVLHLTDDNGWYKDSTHIYMHGFVLAWMPLPEPYREEGTE